MPQNAIQSHVVDFVLAPANMPAKLLEIKQKAPYNSRKRYRINPNQMMKFSDRYCCFCACKEVLILHIINRPLYAGVCSEEWHLTIRRTPSVYLGLLQENPGELENLYKDLLIPVTSFFP